MIEPHITPFPGSLCPFLSLDMMRVKIESVRNSASRPGSVAVIYTAAVENMERMLKGAHSCCCSGHVGREVGGLPMCVCSVVDAILSE